MPELTLFLLVGACVLIFLWMAATYNRLVKRRSLCANSFAQIDVQLKRRNDLIDNLVEGAKAAMKHEQGTLEGVIRARNFAEGARFAVSGPKDTSGLANLFAAEGNLRGSINQFFVIAEKYPELKANQNIIDLSMELTRTENTVAVARQAYNDSVMIFNNTRETFPSNLVAGMFGLSSAISFDAATESERRAVKVQF